jgi:hypothetical protein
MPHPVDGDLVCAPTDTAKQLFLNMVPLLKEFNSYQKIILTPLPRYLYAPCCTDQDHIPNLENEDHVPKLLADLDSTHRLWRGIAFRDKISNFKICNVSKLLEEQTWWRSDPVHPTVEGYNRVSTFILKGFRALLEKRDETAGGGDNILATGVKRAAEDSAVSAPKRPAWLSRSENYVTRCDNGPFRGRGGSSSGGGWGNSY